MVSIRIIFEWILLLIMGIQDYRRQEIHIVLLILFTVIGLAICFIEKSLVQSGITMMCAFLILTAGLLVRKCSKGGIGMGDIWLLSALALWEFGYRLSDICIVAVILSGINSFVVYFWKQPQKAIAFVPWVGVSSLLLNIL